EAVAGEIEHQRIVVAREERMAEANEGDLVAELEDGGDFVDERPDQVEQARGLERAAADENAVGLIGQRHVGAADIAGDERLVAGRILDDQLAVDVDAVFDAVVDRGDPRAVGIDRPDEAVQHLARVDDHIVGVAAGAVDEDVVRYRKSVFSRARVDDCSWADAQYRIVTIAEVDNEVRHRTFDRVVAITGVERLQSLRIISVKSYNVVSVTEIQ